MKDPHHQHTPAGMAPATDEQVERVMGRLHLEAETYTARGAVPTTTAVLATAPLVISMREALVVLKYLEQLGLRPRAPRIEHQSRFPRLMNGKN